MKSEHSTIFSSKEKENEELMRFIIERDDSQYFEDTLDCYKDGTFKSYWFSEHEDFCEVVDLLNELDNTNKKLQKIITCLREENEEFNTELLEYDSFKRFHNEMVERLHEEIGHLQKSLSASVEKNRKLQTILDKLGYEYMGDLK